MSSIPDRKSVAAPRLVEMNVVKPKPPPAPPPVVEPPPEPPKPEPEVRPKLVKKKTVEKIIADEPAPPPKPEPEKPKPPPAGFSIDMSSTVVGGGVAVPAVEGGGNMFANPNDKTLPPGPKQTERPPPEQGKGRGTAPAGAYQVTKMPEFLGSERDRTPPYPESAKQREVEGQVLLKVYVGVSGRVEDVKLVRRLDPSCDDVAVKWAKEKFRFKPAMAGDEPVGMWIDVPVTFVIER